MATAPGARGSSKPTDWGPPAGCPPIAIDQRVLHTAGAQQLDDPVSDVALPDAVQRGAHSRPSEPEPRRIDLQRFVAHAGDGFPVRTVETPLRRRLDPNQRLGSAISGGSGKSRPITKTVVPAVLTAKSRTSKTRRSVSSASPARATT